MGFSYNKLWKLLIDKNMKKTDLQCAIATTPKTIAKMGRDENVSLETLGKICEYFQCDIGDIIEYRRKNEEEIKWDLLVAKRDFEIQTIDLLINELKFKGVRLGESRKPDVIISYGINGVIIDNKAYSTGYNLPINQADEMIRYIEENQNRDEKINSNKWWESFDEKIKDFNYLFVSSFFKGNFKNNLKHIANRTGVNGGAINVENLLYFAEELKSGRLSYIDSFKTYDNDEIYVVEVVDYRNINIAAEDQGDYFI